VAIASLLWRQHNTGGSASPVSEGDVELTLVSYAVRAAYERSFLSSPLSGNKSTTKTLPLTKAMVGLAPKPCCN